jgi:hypothetical protein
VVLAATTQHATVLASIPTMPSLVYTTAAVFLVSAANATVGLLVPCGTATAGKAGGLGSDCCNVRRGSHQWLYWYLLSRRVHFSAWVGAINSIPKEEEDLITSQSIQRSYTAGDIVPRTAQERAELQLRKLAGIPMTVIAAIDEMHQQAEAYCSREIGQQDSRTDCVNALL